MSVVVRPRRRPAVALLGLVRPAERDTAQPSVAKASGERGDCPARLGQLQARLAPRVIRKLHQAEGQQVGHSEVGGALRRGAQDPAPASAASPRCQAIRAQRRE